MSKNSAAAARIPSWFEFIRRPRLFGLPLSGGFCGCLVPAGKATALPCRSRRSRSSFYGLRRQGMSGRLISCCSCVSRGKASFALTGLGTVWGREPRAALSRKAGSFALGYYLSGIQPFSIRVHPRASAVKNSLHALRSLRLRSVCWVSPARRRGPAMFQCAGVN